MSDRHLAHWPAGVPRHLEIPQTSLWGNVEAAAARHPDKPFILYYDTPISFGEFRAEAERFAGYLQADCGVRAGDRVLLYLQNSPQWILAYYAILRADAVVVPINPMNVGSELRHYVDDAGARVAVVAQDLLAQIEPLLEHDRTRGEGLQHAVVATYSDYLRRPTDLRLPDFVAAPRAAVGGAGRHAWADMLAAARRPSPHAAGPDDLCVMPYTSGTTGQPKGCMHSHRNVMTTAVGGVVWFGNRPETVALSVLPFFHVTGMTGGMNSPLYLGSTIVLLPRWDRDAAAACIARYRVQTWQAISTMVVDFLANPRLDDYDLGSLKNMRGGGAAMPQAVYTKLKEVTGVDYVEGYGMSETIAATHINPPQRPKKQCLGIPVFDVDSRVVDIDTLRELAPGQSGEIVIHAPQVMQGYWRNPEATRAAFVQIDGKRFLRTGDLGMIDEDGYFFMTDRLKRMINAAGFKVWPAEVEAILYRHPAVHEACVIAARDERRGETVKALVVLRPEQVGRVQAQDIRDWAQHEMAAYKIPRIIEFVDSLPKSGSGKLLWRQLQDRELRGTANQEERDMAGQARAGGAGR
jgi:fatty-acyl-CoA synthase